MLTAQSGEKFLYIKTYGCQMNVYDSIKMQDLLSPFGYSLTEEMNSADMIILNTCHIREKAAEKMYSELGRIRQLKEARKKLNQETIITVAGCVGQAEGEEIFARAPYVDIIVGPQSYHTLPELLAKLARKEKNLIELDFVLEAKFDQLPEETAHQGPSSFISVQEGCDKFCTFCVVPYTRGAEFSRPVEQIYRESLGAISKGSQEVIFLGQNVNAYHGVDANGKSYDLADLIQFTSSHFPQLPRIRYLTSHPNDMSAKLITLHGKEERLMPFLHLPVQSGSDVILKAMNRKHTRDEYFRIIDALRAARSDIVFSSDFIVGFPGETDADFALTLDLVQKVKYGQCYSFKYSPRPGTPAAMKAQVPEQVKNERLSILQAELSKQALEFNQSCVGKIMPVLFERDGKLSGQVLGKTPYMQSVYLLGIAKDLVGKIVDVKITQAFSTSLTGCLVSETATTYNA